MDENGKSAGLLDLIKEGLGSIPQLIAAAIVPPMAIGTDQVMQIIEERVTVLEKRILKDVAALLIIGSGSLLLIIASLYYMTEDLSLSRPAAFFIAGSIILVIGILLKQDRR